MTTTTTTRVVTAGADTDLTEGKPLKEIVIQYIIDNWDKNWDELPPKTKVHFRLWYTGTPGLHIAATDIHRTYETRSLGQHPALIFCKGIVLLDLFALSVNCCRYPPELAAATSFIENLVERDTSGLVDKGINQIRVFAAAEEREQDPTSAVFHYSIQVECIYVKTVAVEEEPAAE